MRVAIQPMSPSDWPVARAIYAEGIATGHANLRKECAGMGGMECGSHRSVPPHCASRGRHCGMGRAYSGLRPVRVCGCSRSQRLCCGGRSPVGRWNGAPEGANCGFRSRRHLDITSRHLPGEYGKRYAVHENRLPRCGSAGTNRPDGRTLARYVVTREKERPGWNLRPKTKARRL